MPRQSRDELEKRVAERTVELAGASQMLQMVMDTIPVRIFWKSEDLVYLGCNSLFAKDAGRKSPGELLGKSDYDMGWREQADLYRNDDMEVMRSGNPKLGYEEPQTTPDGKKIWLRTSKIPLRDINNRIIGILGTYEDITAHKQAVEAMRRQNEYLTALQETMLDVASQLDLDRLLENILKRAGQLMGTSTGFLDLLEPGDDHLTPKIALGVLAEESVKYKNKTG